MKRNLLLLRHVKSDWAQVNIADKDRPISKERIDDLNLVVQHFNSFELRIDAIKCSTAKRTLQTAGLFTASIDQMEACIDHEPGLYLCTVPVLRQVIASTSEHVKTLLIVGHNPTLSEWLAHYSKNVEQHMSTSSLAWFSFDSSHWNISPTTPLKLEWLGIPKRLRNFK